ncbi:hypothetical protein [Chitinophaga sp. LS1]|uniref:hypothetical protein n=1 Tax=Chitinophaga sp. LS1 TaxID=3051176 RepID=UPI002AAA96B3|nr:hypothetical protein [Chitinophaga sp. LS1]WPV67524.1 hypothetical protein QQL36_02135 [Chitinophaga sp. LS1]
MAKLTLEQLDKLGLSAAKAPIERAIQDGLSEASISFPEKQGKDDLIIYLSFRLLPDLKSIDLTEYEILLKLPIVPIHAQIDGIDTANLERKLSEIDWGQQLSKTNGVYNTMIELLSTLYALEQAGTDGYAISRQLQVKYLTGTPFAKSIAGDFRLKLLSEKHYPRQSFRNHFPSVKEAHLFMRHELKIKGWDLPEGIKRKGGRAKKL